jgi:hypothetical protein
MPDIQTWHSVTQWQDKGNLENENFGMEDIVILITSQMRNPRKTAKD